ncbi:MAG: DnaJ domain-containing protein [Pseudomonadota bacterium]
MKYKDYYATLGIARDAGEADIKKAYRKLAHKYHPDVSKEEGAEARFKEIAEAYQTLKDTEKRAAYDQLGRHAPGEEIQPPPQWQARDAGDVGETGSAGFEGFDLADLFARMRGHDAGGRGASIAMPGEDHEASVHISLEQAYLGTQVELQLVAPQRDAQGRVVSTPRTLRVRIPKGATEGQRVRLAGQGGKGFNGGRDGDLYVRIELLPHRFYRPDEQVFGSNSLYSTFNTLSGTRGNWNYLVNADYRRSDSERDNGDYDVKGADLHAGYKLDAGQSLAFDLHAYSSDNGEAGRMSYAQFEADPHFTVTPKDHDWVQRYTGVLSYRGEFGKNLLVESKLWGGYHDQSERNAAGAAPGAIPASMNLVDQEFRYVGLDTRGATALGPGQCGELRL